MEENCPYGNQSTDPFHHTCKDCRDQTCSRHQLALHMVKALNEDGESFIARIAPDNMQYLDLQEGDYLCISGKRGPHRPFGTGQRVRGRLSNIPNALDPALRRPGRFDREIAIQVPDEKGRYEILGIHSRNMPLAGELDLKIWSKKTHGFVGADLKALCQEAGLHALRRIRPELELEKGTVTPEFLENLFFEKNWE